MKMKGLFCERDCQTAIPDLRFEFLRFMYTLLKNPPLLFPINQI